MGIIIFLCLAAIVYFLFFRKSPPPPKDCSVNIPIVEMTPLRQWFHVSGILNTEEAYMPIYALITPLLCMNFSLISPIMKDEKKTDELIIKLSMPYFSFLLDCVHEYRYAHGMLQYTSKAGQFFFYSLGGFRRSKPDFVVNTEPSAYQNGNIDSLILTIYDYLLENGEDTITIEKDIVTFMDSWCNIYLFPALTLLQKLGSSVYRLNKEIRL